MDFRSRGAGAPTNHTTTSHTANSAPNNFTSSLASHSKSIGSPKWLQFSSVALLFCITVLIVAIIFLAFAGGSSQAHAVLKDKYQAVFLNNGQVYFGKIKDLNSNFVDLTSIYYLQTNNSSKSSDQSSTNSSNVSLVKLGCELHAPMDEMVINDAQVLFWENLQDGGQVVKAINQYQKDNPKHECNNTSSSTQQAPSSSSNTQSTSPTQTQSQTQTQGGSSSNSDNSASGSTPKKP